MKNTFCLLLIFIHVVSYSFGQIQGSDDTYYKSPDINITDINGENHNLYELLDEGKYVLIDIYTTWCQPCRDNAPFVEEWYEEHGPAGEAKVEMWNIEADANGTDLEDVLDWIEEFGVTCPVFEDNDSYFWSLDEFPFNGYPAYFVICPDRYYNIVDGQGDELIASLNQFIEDCPEIGTNDHDASILAFDPGKNNLCENHSAKIRIENKGMLDLENLTIETFVNGNLDNAHEWTGNLAQFEDQKIELPILTGNYAFGTNEIEVRLTSPNGEADGNISNNNESGSYTLIDGITPSINAGFGYGAQSYHFEIVNASDEIVYEHYFLESSSYSFENVELCIEADQCYTFKIYDVASTGSGGGFIFDQEYIDLQLNGEQLLYIDQNNYSEQNGIFEFCIEAVSALDNSASNQIRFFPNPSNGMVHYTNQFSGQIEICLYNSLGHKIKSIRSSDPSGHFFVHEPGLYIISVTKGENNELTHSLLLIE